MRRLESAAIIGGALSILLTVALLDFGAIQLSRQVTYAAPRGADKILVLAYQYTLYLLACVPLGLLFSLLLRWKIESVRLRRAGLFLAAMPVAIAVLGLASEGSADRIAFRDVQSGTAIDLNVVLIVVDTLRADHLGSYGYDEETSPFMDSVAAEGVRFARCHAPASWTKPSTASILTSLYPGQHGAVNFQQQLPLAVNTIAEIMADAGFVTYGYVANPNLKTLFNFDQGFQFYDDHLMRDRLWKATLRSLPRGSQALQSLVGRSFDSRDNSGIEAALPRITPWLERYHRQNFFMYLHFMDPHLPYAPPPPYDTMFPGQDTGDRRLLTRLYDGEIRYLDTHLKQLFGEFDRLGLSKKTLFVLTSDHGEAFGEHRDWGHDHTVYQEQLHVPLIMRYPRESWGGEVVESAVRSLDIAPTILDYAGIEVPEAMRGQSLRRQIERGEDAEVFIDHSSARNDFRLKALIVEGRYKFIRTLRSPARSIASVAAEELYDLRADPGERKDLSTQLPEVAHVLRERLGEYERNSSRVVPQPPPLELDAGTSEQLRALGYID